jgi:pyridoxine kinase
VSQDGGLNILSIQSSVAYGHVGNSAAVFPLQRLGIEVWAVNTVHFSNHTGYGEWRGPVLAAGDVAEVLRGIEERGAFGSCAAVLSGYMGDASLGEVILGAVERVRGANPRALFCCDPVMGDEDRGFFVRPGIPGFMRERAVPAADVVTPNQFELEYLAGVEARTLGGALAAAEKVLGLGPGTALVTSLRRRDAAEEGRIEMLAATREGAWLVGTPLLPLAVNGAGDATAALFLAHLLLGRGVEEALSLTASSVYAVLEKTFRRGAREIQLVAAQESLVAPPVRFPTRRVA